MLLLLNENTQKHTEVSKSKQFSTKLCSVTFELVAFVSNLNAFKWSCEQSLHV